jgi:hypothetical protein
MGEWSGLRDGRRGRVEGFIQKAGPAAHKAKVAVKQRDQQELDDQPKAVSASAEYIWRTPDRQQGGEN